MFSAQLAEQTKTKLNVVVRLDSPQSLTQIYFVLSS